MKSVPIVAATVEELKAMLEQLQKLERKKTEETAKFAYQAGGMYGELKIENERLKLLLMIVVENTYPADVLGPFELGSQTTALHSAMFLAARMNELAGMSDAEKERRSKFFGLVDKFMKDQSSKLDDEQFAAACVELEQLLEEVEK
jgi:hypothetical protein